MSKKSFYFLFLIVGALFLFRSHSYGSKVRAAPVATETAKYKIVFNATWSPSTPHPYPGGTGTFPGGAHFSALIGGVHSDKVTFWQSGQLASAGIERMAETGSTIILASEVNNAITAGKAKSVILGSDINTPGTTTINEIVVAVDHPHVTLVSMIAPSPDWFVGISGLSLMENGDWVNEKTINLTAWDAGTEEGSGFSLSNPDTNPHEAIRQLTTHSLGTFTFTRTDAPSAFFGLAVSKTGNGTGSISSNPAGIDCGATCELSVLEQTVVTLTAQADPDSIFSGWSGAGCSGTGTCVVTMDGAKSVTASFIVATKSVYLPVISKP